MKNTEIPFNVTLLDASKERFQNMRPVTTTDIFYGQTNEFHEDGLFSTLIFGRVGESDRLERFSYIDMHAYVLHPTIYRAVTSIKRIYTGIMAGNIYATWNDRTKDFERSSESEGSTGYQFFMSHWHELKISKNNSDQRNLKVDLLNKYQDKALVRYLVVMPAGLRDLTVDENGKKSQDEINDLYQRAISISNSIAGASNAEDSTYDNARWALQTTFLEIYEMIHRIVSGKKGFILDKWGSRRVYNSTRNVITAYNEVPERLGGPVLGPTVTDCIMGMHQAMAGAMPVTLNALRNGLIGRVFSGGDARVRLIDKETLAAEYVDLSADVRDRWTSIEGLEKLIHGYGTAAIRHRRVEIEGRYLGLIYDDGKHVRIVDQLEDIAEEQLEEVRGHIRPITWAELFYLDVSPRLRKLAAIITRYPVTGLGSTFPANIYTKTTVKGYRRVWVDENFQPTDVVYNEFPDTLNEGAHHDGLTVSSSRLKGLGADEQYFTLHLKEMGIK